MAEERKNVVDRFLSFVADMATVSQKEALNAIKAGDMETFHRKAGVTMRLNSVADVDGVNRSKGAMREARKRREES